jgi:hypothetical protein
MIPKSRLFTIYLAVSSAQLIASRAEAIECPVSMNQEGDWDRDGILNRDDNCCYVATLPEHNESSYCSEEDGADVNMNGIPQGEEGECCITPDGMCGGAETPTCTEGQEHIAVRCDWLLFYSGMWVPFEVASCGESCVCNSVEDFDNDFTEVTDSILSGAEDDCPETVNLPLENIGQANSDDDIFGDACDSCTDFFDEPIQCEMGSEENRCPLESNCVPFVFFSNDRVTVQQFCSSPETGDKDQDGVDDRCDEGVDTDTDTGTDTDTDGDTDTDTDTDGDTDTDTDMDVDTDSDVDMETDWVCDAGCDTDERDASMRDTDTSETDRDSNGHDSEPYDTSHQDAGDEDAGWDSEKDTGSENKDSDSTDTEDKETDSNDTSIDSETSGLNTDVEETDSKDGDTTDTVDKDTASETEDDTADKKDTDSIREDVYLGGALSCNCKTAPGNAPVSLFELIAAILSASVFE